MVKKRNRFKSYITSGIGTITMVLTLILVWKNNISFVWEGIAGLSIGCILFMAPQAVERIVGNGIRYLARNNTNGQECNDGIPPNPPRTTD